jgi:hypothetical protein
MNLFDVILITFFSLLIVRAFYIFVKQLNFFAFAVIGAVLVCGITGMILFDRNVCHHDANVAGCGSPLTHNGLESFFLEEFTNSEFTKVSVEIVKRTRDIVVWTSIVVTEGREEIYDLVMLFSGTFDKYGGAMQTNSTVNVN